MVFPASISGFIEVPDSLHYAMARKRMEAKLQDMTLELSRSNEVLMEFAHTVAYDLKQPLRTLTGFIHIFAHRYKDRMGPAADQDILQIVRSAEWMAALIDDLFMYTKVGSGDLNTQPICIEDALQSALENLKKVIEDSHSVVTHDPLPTLFCDPIQTVCLLQNLIDNAIKFHGPDAPRIKVSAKVNGPEWVFAVRDNGIGIDPQYHGRIFEMFERLHTQIEYPGTGIGLAICKKMVERNKGRIWADSRLGEGATFHFTLPAQPP